MSQLLYKSQFENLGHIERNLILRLRVKTDNPGNLKSQKESQKLCNLSKKNLILNISFLKKLKPSEYNQLRIKGF